MVDDFAKIMRNMFQISMNRDINFFLGLQVKQVQQGIFIHLEKYTKNFLKKYSMDNYFSAKVLLAFGYKIDVYPTRESIKQNIYLGMTSSLMYLTASGPDIVFVSCLCFGYKVDPNVTHLNAVKQSFRYLKWSKALGLWYPSGNDFSLQAFTYSGHAG